MGWLWWLIIVPILDLVLLSRVMLRVGGARVVVWLALAALIGLLAIRTRGSRLHRQSGSADPDPDAGALDRLLIALAGILLIFPGPLSDLLGLALLVPGLRRRVRERLLETVLGRILASGVFQVFTSRGGERPSRGPGSARPPESEVPSAYPGAENARDVEFQEIPSRERERPPESAAVPAEPRPEGAPRSPLK